MSDKIKSTYAELTEAWSIDDAADAHDILDYFDALSAEYEMQAKIERSRR